MQLDLITLTEVSDISFFQLGPTHCEPKRGVQIWEYYLTQTAVLNWDPQE